MLGRFRHDTSPHCSLADTIRRPRPSAASPLMMAEEVEECITACVACQAICLQTVFYCLKIGGARASADHVRMLLDCAEMCRSTVHFMFAGSAFQSRVCALCSEVCKRCEASCRAMGEAQDLRCAEACHCCALMLHQAHHVQDSTLNDGS